MHCIHHQLSGWIWLDSVPCHTVSSALVYTPSIWPPFKITHLLLLITFLQAAVVDVDIKILQISHGPWHINKLPLHEEKCRLWLSHFPQALEIWFYCHHAFVHLYWISTVGHKVISKHARIGSTFMNERSCQRTKNCTSVGKDLNVFFSLQSRKGNRKRIR